MTKLVVLYPRGSGGSWLSNLIWHLENNDFTIPKVNIVFDNEPKSNLVMCTHAAHEMAPGMSLDLINFDYGVPVVRFASDCLFNMYVNEVHKVRYVILSLGEKSLREQFFTLTNNFTYAMTDELWHNTYCRDYVLNYRHVFTDPEQFINSLFALLEQHAIKFTPDRDYCLRSIEYYRSTCRNPKDVIGNLDDLTWLAACHGVSILKNIPLPVVLEGSSIEELKAALAPLNDLTIEYINPKVLYWNELTT